MSSLHFVLLFVAMGVVTLISRTVFFISEREIVLPEWVRRGLRYAPLAALGAVVAPEILMVQGRLIDTFEDARIYAVLAGSAWYYWRGGVLGTIIAGMIVLVPLKLVLGW